MKFLVAGCTEIGTRRKKNQDAIAIMQAHTRKGEALLAIVCDGMGGLESGELASASVIQDFTEWFEVEFPRLLEQFEPGDLMELWEKKIQNLDARLKKYGREQGFLLGTTFSGILLLEESYGFLHVGDSRIYYLNAKGGKQLTVDHTVIAEALAAGTMTTEEAKVSDKRGKLTQCVGASRRCMPQKGCGQLRRGEGLLLGSDGLFHKISQASLLAEFPFSECRTEDEMKDICCRATERVMERGEKDNISVILIKAE